MDLLQTFRQHWEAKKFVAPGQTVLLAVSGGIDSMVMAELCHRSGISFTACHCNFGLRGAESDADEQLVADWATTRNVPFYNIRFETKQRSEEWKKGTQETARILRYEWFDILRQEKNYAAIATAHHANDNAETLLINLFKGTGIAGLHGIQERNGSVIRPLLFATREEIVAYAAQNNINYREDASNASDDYLRNAVRHHIVPAVDKLFPNVVERLNESIARFGQAELLYNKAVEQYRKKLLDKRGNDTYISILQLQHAQPLETICYELFKPYGFSPQQVDQILRLLESESGRYVSSETHRVIRNRNFLILTSNISSSADHIVIEGFPCTVQTEHGKFHFSLDKTPDTIPSAATVACVDASLLSLPLTLRKWKTGDYFYPLGMGMKRKKLSKFFIDQKIPVHEKEKIWVLECNRRIVWVAGMRLDDRFKIGKDTQEIVRIEYKQA
jgi:tRNA(Ile)-lysidine synthase